MTNICDTHIYNIHICDLYQSRVWHMWHDSCIFHIYDIHAAIISMTHRCDVHHAYIWHSYLWHTCIQWYALSMWHDSCIIHVYDIMGDPYLWLTYVCHASYDMNAISMTYMLHWVIYYCRLFYRALLHKRSIIMHQMKFMPNLWHTCIMKWHMLFICDMYMTFMCDPYLWHTYVCHASYDMHAISMTYMLHWVTYIIHVWHESYIIHMYDIHVWFIPITFTCVTCIIHMWYDACIRDMTHSYVTQFIHMAWLRLVGSLEL